MDSRPVDQPKKPWRFVIVTPLLGAALLLCACASPIPPATHYTAPAALPSAAAVRPTLPLVKTAPPPTSPAALAPSVAESPLPTGPPSPLSAPHEAVPASVTVSLDVSDWPVYADQQRGIQLRYPPSFFHFEDPYAADVAWLEWSVLFLDNKFQEDRPPQAPDIAIQTYPNPGEVAPADWLLHHSTTAPFGAEVDLEPPVLYLWPDEPVRSVTVAGREGTRFAVDAMGLRLPAVLLPHREWLLEISYGDFGPDRLEPIFESILETLNFEAGETDEGLMCFDVQEGPLTVCLSETYTVSRKDEPNRRGSFASFDLRAKEGCQPPCLEKVQFFSEESIREFNANCDANTEYPCFFGDYPDLERYHGQREALNSLEDYRDYELEEINGRYYLATNRPCYGDSCLIREYTTFVSDIKIDVWIAITSESQVAECNPLLTQLVIQDSSR